MRRGISFEIPNKYGRWLEEMLKPINIAAFDWQIGSSESYTVIDDRLEEELFSNKGNVIEGTELKNRVEANQYYIISVDLQAFPKNTVNRVETFEEFIESDCQLVLLVVDCIYVTIYCKNQETIESLNKNAITCGFGDIEYITNENDARTKLSVW
ncbi:DUF2691 family protein [Planomicrobium sp. Y74]|uniref:DUF2691 family protein n=1 Tax=Planomicrobium sp. Y74 TaxID=2478977 RepID=UPI000EF4F8E6|nr:DUF2691 family protein [Planomicrobium sp. Y74]RLQ90855.1 DUF2691 family protein [Planomicrobium sp. Y74]